MKAAEKNKTNNALWLAAWTATFVSFAISSSIAKVIAGSVIDPLTGLLAGALSGVVIGLAQMLVLRLIQTNVSWILVGRWAGATAIGLSVGLATGGILVGFRIGALDLAVMGLVCGICVGALQAWALKDQVRRSWIWFVASPFLWAAGWLISWSIGVDVTQHWAVFGSSGSIVYTVIAGFVLHFLLRERVLNAANTGQTGQIDVLVSNNVRSI